MQRAHGGLSIRAACSKDVGRCGQRVSTFISRLTAANTDVKVRWIDENRKIQSTSQAEI
jgi:hypothetical protein